MIEAVEDARNDWFWRGSGDDHKDQIAEQALAAAPDDPRVVWRCLGYWHHYAMPVADYGWGPPRPVGRARLDQALAAADRILAGKEPTTRDERLLFFYTRTIQALDLIIEPPTEDQLARAGALCDEVYKIIEKPAVEDEKEHRDDWFRMLVLARRRAWELVAAGPPFSGDSATRLAAYLNAWESCYGWPVRPLCLDPRFLAWAKKLLEERASQRAHPTPKQFVWLRQYVTERDAPSADELHGRLLLLATVGMDQAFFQRYVQAAIEDKLPPVVLDVMLSLGFDPNGVVDEDDGQTLLHLAVAAHDAEAVRRLIAAGADPDRVATPKKKRAKAESPRQLAERNKRRAVLVAFNAEAGGGSDAPSSGAEAALGAAITKARRELPQAWWTWISELFGAEKLDLDAFIATALRSRPETADDLLNDAEGTPFERFLLATLLHRAGFRKDRKHKGPLVIDGDVIVTGDLVVEGPILDTLAEGSLLVAGSVKAQALVTEADCLVGGDLDLRDFVWGNYNDCSLVVGGSIRAPLVVMTDHTCAANGGIEAARYEEDADGEALVTIFDPALIDDGSVDRERLIARLRKGQSVLASTKKAPAKVKAKPKAVAKSKPKAKAKSVAKPKPKPKTKSKLKPQERS